MHFNMKQTSLKIKISFYAVLQMPLSVCSVTLTFNMREVSLSSLAGKQDF